MNRIFLLLLGCLASISFAQTDSIKVEDWTFSHAAVSIEGGEVYPFGDLVDAVYNTYYGGFGFRYSYWENVDGVVMFHYSYFEPRPKEVVYDGVHQFMGKVGLDWRFKVIEPVVLGGGFACNWTRADYEEKDKPGFNEPGGTLTDNETEFGWYARMKVDIVKLEKYRVGLNVMWEEIWTLPKRSDMLYAGFYIERSLW
jgi:hypothetical protein